GDFDAKITRRTVDQYRQYAVGLTSGSAARYDLDALPHAAQLADGGCIYKGFIFSSRNHSSPNNGCSVRISCCFLSIRPRSRTIMLWLRKPEAAPTNFCV